ncbi:nickel pincer cofactor biosynthesis protein LarB [Zavarzinella formosa]|uniref:nickel pincer cofactor biosynthesis protein LarB n=1 Tax=Zavarzinella formosa TaxID=360055 RepID=UPI0002FAC339|nr:nickel pincer cofactor biosynthesis protein LarB [Zavarzinella formosa]
MSPDQLRDVLEQVRHGRLTVDDAVGRLAVEEDGNLGYARVDLDRKRRCGFPEVIFCEGKTPEWVEGVARRLIGAGQDCFGTRVSDAQANHLQGCFPTAEQDRLARTFWLPVAEPSVPATGKVLVLTAGTADLPVAREAAVTARVLGCAVELIADVGVAGLHRLLKQRDNINNADVIIVVAGMDGALPSVVGGLADCPVIAVPTSIGYGAAFQGLAPLLTMLNACSASVTVVNIDAGFKAGYSAALICKRMSANRE